MTETRIDSLAERIKVFERSNEPDTKHPNRYTAPAVQLKKRLDILWAQLRANKTNSSYKSPRYVTPDNSFSMIVEDYDIMMTDVYRHLSYLISLDKYTKQVTNNRGYYCRKKQQIHMYLISTYTSTPHSVYTMRDVAWEWFFKNPAIRQPLHSFLFNYLISLQDDT